MLFSRAASILVLGSAVAPATSQTVYQSAFRLARTYNRNTNFFDKFFVRDRAFFQQVAFANDPTYGFVDYVTGQDAIDSGLMSYRGNQMFIGADNTTKLTTDSIGRRSVRLESKQTFSRGLMIADIQHMPGTACGSWPAFWLFNFSEKPYSEIDIIEGNGWASQSANMVSAHTCGSCSFPALKGDEVRTDCNLAGGSSNRCEPVENGAGCGKDLGADSIGTGFNRNGGGVYAALIDRIGIHIWFFPRARIPEDVKSGRPNPNLWGRPAAEMRSSPSCDVPERFRGMSIVINLTFCGNIIYDWEEQTRYAPQCRSSEMTCEQYVAANPSAYTEAYWLFNYIKLYG